ncbi:MAG: GTP-binding protein [Myxococcota bacterium]
MTLITGFLGSGKTTLLNHLLQSRAGLRFVIIENEFGDLNVDSALVGASEDTVVALSDGCLCCVVRDDLIATLLRLAERREQFDHVLIEASGLADPAPVLQVFETAAVRMSFSLNGAVTVVDARHIAQSLTEVRACAEQIACADLLLINHTDKQTPETVGTVEKRLRRINPLAQIQQTEHAQVDLQDVLNLEKRRLGPSIADPTAHNHHHDHHHDHHHEEDIGSVSVEVVGEVDVQALDDWLGQLVRQEDLLRMKGVLAVKGQPRQFVFHGVRTVVEVRPAGPWGDAPRRNQVVFIGRALDADALRTGFLACLRV